MNLLAEARYAGRQVQQIPGVLRVDLRRVAPCDTAGCYMQNIVEHDDGLNAESAGPPPCSMDTLIFS